MFHLLGFLFIILIAVFVIGLTIVGSVFKAIFGFGRKSRPSSSEKTRRTYRTTDHTTGNGQSGRQSSQEANEDVINGKSAQAHKKIFTKDEGEYVDFEEVKE